MLLSRVTYITGSFPPRQVGWSALPKDLLINSLTTQPSDPQTRILSNERGSWLTGRPFALSTYTNSRATEGTALFWKDCLDWNCITWPHIHTQKQTSEWVCITVHCTSISLEMILTWSSLFGSDTVGTHSSTRWTRPDFTSFRVYHWNTAIH